MADVIETAAGPGYFLLDKKAIRELERAEPTRAVRLLDGERVIFEGTVEQALKATYFDGICRRCGRQTGGAWRKSPEGRFRSPRQHPGIDGAVCPGSFEPDVDPPS